MLNRDVMFVKPGACDCLGLSMHAFSIQKLYRYLMACHHRMHIGTRLGALQQADQRHVFQISSYLELASSDLVREDAVSQRHSLSLTSDGAYIHRKGVNELS
jgi:hypothetical protein